MIQFRPLADDERNYVIDSWARSFSNLSRDHGKRLPIAPADWHQIHRVGINYLLGRDDVFVVAATLETLPDEIVGWVCWQRPSERSQLRLHYVMVKEVARRRGIGRRLVHLALREADQRGFVCTHPTWMWKRLAAKLYASEEAHAV